MQDMEEFYCYVIGYVACCWKTLTVGKSSEKYCVIIPEKKKLKTLLNEHKH